MSTCEQPSVPQRLTQRLSELVTANSIPGMSVTCTLPDGKHFGFDHGRRADAPDSLLDSDSIFGVASITKTLTALVTVLLADCGALSIDDPVSRWLPLLRLPNGAENSVTIRHLLSHTSGLPGLPLIHGARTPSILSDPDSRRLADRAPIAEDWAWIRNIDDLISALAQHPFQMLGKPGEAFNYSNEGYGLLQGIIESAAGTSFEECLVTRVFDPLGIQRYGLTVGDLSGQENIVPLFAPMADVPSPFTLSPTWWDVGDIHTNGSLKISSRDLLKLTDDLMRSASGDPRAHLLSRSAVVAMTTVQSVLPDQSLYGLGLELSPGYDHSWFGHGGSIKGVSSQFRCYPEAGLSIVCLINASDAPASEVVEAIAGEVFGTLTSAEKEPAIGADPDRANRIGHYESMELNEIDVVEDNGVLHVRRDGRGGLLPLQQTGRDAFVTAQGKSFVFLRDPDGTVNGLFCSKRVHPKT
jgi:CubicO group peptidase (beta-lactamase class C family)